MRAVVALCVLVASLASGQLLRSEKMHLGVYNPETKHYEQPLLGEDGHDEHRHSQPLLGQDGHDHQRHGQPLLGQDGHDHQHHGQPLLGQDGHGQQHHGQGMMLGRDGHDHQRHGQFLLGQDGHDQRPHTTQHLLGQDGHDHQRHSQRILGGDDHDKKQHSKKHGKHGKHKGKKHLLGQDNHDFKKHSKKRLLGTDGHDLTHEGGAFKAFMVRHNKTYTSTAHYHHRHLIFSQNMRKVHVLQHNEQGSATYGASKFADLTEAEFQKMLGLRPRLKPEHSNMRPALMTGLGNHLPTSIDWRDQGIVTPVKNQGECGSCWAFSTTGNVEGQWAIKHKELYSLSEQELVDCDSEDQGCNGGLPENAYEAIAKLGGLETENDYPYDGVDEQCHYNGTLARVTVNGSLELPQDENLLAKWLVKNGPISIGINANALQFYMGGVSHPLKFLCNPADLDHGMLIVGYGVHTTKYLHRRQPYWLVKNSWGEDWGEQGYYKVYRGDGTCGVNMMATSAIVP